MIQDAVYGPIEITGPLARLYSSPTVQRLAKIRQGGAAFLAFPFLNTTRLEHSLGVSFLIRSLGGGVEEQIAGLLHDISHTAFSHVSDYLFENKAENFHELHKERFILETEIADLLRSEGMDPEIFLDDSKWPRLESPLPDLCADRIDYTLRDYVQWAHRPAADANSFVNSLAFMKGKIVVQSTEKAIWFQNFFKELNSSFFRHPRNLEASKGLADILKKALVEEVISEGDLFSTDELVLAKINSCHLRDDLEQLKVQLSLENNSENAGTGISVKSRSVDPWVLTKSQQIVRFSTV